MKTNRPPNPEIDEIREIRHQLSAESGHNPAKFLQDLIQFQKRFEPRFIKTKQSVGIEKSVLSPQ